MFASDNYASPGIVYDYDALNQLLADRCGDPESEFYADNIKNYSDQINDSIVERGGLMWVGETIVGQVTATTAR